MDLNSKLVVNIDVFDLDFAVNLARDIGNEVFAVKINWPLLMANGTSVISDLKKFSRVICDLKIADIPNTNGLIAGKVSDEGAWGVISHPFVGTDSLRSVVEKAGETKVFSVVAMSHPGAAELIYPNMDRLIEISREAGVYGLIAPGNVYDVLDAVRSKAPEMKILTPGIGAQGGTASLAVRHGSDYVSAGRIVYNAKDPLEVVRRLNAEISAAQASGNTTR